MENTILYALMNMTAEKIDIEENEVKDAAKDASSSKDPMQHAITETPFPPKDGDIIEGAVLAKEKNTLYVDLGIFGTGIIYGREFLNARDIIKNTKIDDVIAAKIVDLENDKGYVELSLKEAKQAVVWQEAEAALKGKQTYELAVKEANKGGLLMEWQGVLGFLPASQLKPEHYPRVEDGDKDRIESELKKLIGEKLEVSIIAAEREEGKLIFSEKSPASPEREKIVSKYSVGDVVNGEVTGAVDFGVFVKIEDGLEGLIHISEMDWALVENPRERFPQGSQIEAKIIEIKDDKISLSVKALKENPWKKAAEKYKKDTTVQGVVIKFNKYGALVSIEEGVAGLIHVSEFGSMEKLEEALELGKTYDFTISLFEPNEQRMTLVMSDKK